MSLLKDQITPLTDEDKKKLLEISRQTLNDYLTNYERPKYKVYLPNLLKPRPVFITLRDRKTNDLRGCRGGTKAESPLMEAVIKMTIASATDDPRFSPLILEDVPETKIEINALTPLRRIKPYEVQVGKHGLMIVKDLHAGLLLPQVPVSFGWNQKKFLNQVCIKAGLPPQTWREETGVKLFGFESEEWGEE
ncbi:MAG: AmmeMemoRadiSam system protein A [Calditrichaeota bacterium]|nr:MAG: AmmeMemoRadiSam system protein A [Calditrichota bacterium]MBL1205661.1 AmmeMemoRadiSam system protein A [Calditrichota bacterium]NOG45489.1 AmmeMemoRadiSam system protein A [Calditrichota bacterium]